MFPFDSPAGGWPRELTHSRAGQFAARTEYDDPVAADNPSRQCKHHDVDLISTPSERKLLDNTRFLPLSQPSPKSVLWQKWPSAAVVVSRGNAVRVRHAPK